jgi:hypothetical protein
VRGLSDVRTAYLSVPVVLVALAVLDRQARRTAVA